MPPYRCELTFHTYGTLRVIDDGSWLRNYLGAFTSNNEAALPEPWHLYDVPRDFIEKLIAEIVGIEIMVSRLSGKWKISQNLPLQNQAGVIDDLQVSRSTESQEMATLIDNFINKR